MTERQKGIGALAITLAAWSFSSLFVKYLMPYYDPFTQNVYRYGAGFVVLVPLLVARVRQNPGLLDKRQLLRLLLPTIPNLIHQTAWVAALIWVYPALSAFLNKSSVLFAAAMAYVFFPEERWLFRSPRFLAGLTLTVLGTLGLALLRADLQEAQMNLAVLLVLVAAAAWAVYSVMVKRPVERLGSTVAFSVVCFYSTVVLTLMGLVWGDLGHWRDVPAHVNAVMIFSGVLCIGVAHTTYFHAIKALGVSVCATMLLTTPLVTMVISRWWFGERLTAAQIAGGVLLLVGGALTLLARQKPAVAVIARAAEAADA